MTLINLLASPQGLKGNNANIALAKQLANAEDNVGILELVDNLIHKDKAIQADCIKTLYEIGYLKPALIANHYSSFISLLSNKNNRLVWGAMIALSTIVVVKPKEVFASLDLIMKTVETGSVITIDAGIEILAKLNTDPLYFDTTDHLLVEQLWKCPIKQLPMYMEKSLKSVHSFNKEIYQKIIAQRMVECVKESQSKRLKKTLKDIDNIS